MDQSTSEKLTHLLAPRSPGQPAPGFILAVTAENLDRIRVLADPAPKYELRAAREYLRGDIARVTGSARSCNISLSSLGAALARDHLAAAAQRMSAWLEMRARVVHRRGEAQRTLIEFIPDVDLGADVDVSRLGAAGEALAAQVWPVEDFSDWEEAAGG
jgi:hypothetical protein